MTANIRLDVTYDGTGYSGFQVQAGADTVQGRLEEALGVLYKGKIRVAGAGRTDAGVHARGQVAGYTAPFNIPVERLPLALNSLLPGDIVVTGAAEAPENFHARFSARRKIYSYSLDLAPYPRVMLRRFTWHHPDPVDSARLRQAASLLEGKHDFRSFQAQGSAVRRTERTLFRISVEHQAEEHLLRLIYEGDGFLYKMVRLLTGSLLRAGRGELLPEEMARALSGESPWAVGPTAPAHGLCLEKVIY